MGTSPEARGKAPAPAKGDKIDFSTFKADLSPQDVAKLARSGGNVAAWPLVPIETITPAKTVGRGRTSLAIGDATFFQTDVLAPLVPYATFNQADAADAFVQVQFEPGAYGIANTATYIMEFYFETFVAPTLFQLEGYAEHGSLANAGTRKFILPGKFTMQLILQNVQPGDQTYGNLRQVPTTGSGTPGWIWYSTAIRFPPPENAPPNR